MCFLLCFDVFFSCVDACVCGVFVDFLCVLIGCWLGGFCGYVFIVGGG